MGKAKPVKTTGKGFRLYCQDYRKKRKSKGLKQLTRSELLKKATELWLKLDKREKNRYSSDATRKLKPAPPTRRNIVKSSNKSPQKSRGRVTKRRPVSPTKQKAINRTYRKRATVRRITPSKSRSCSRTSMSRSVMPSCTSVTETGTSCTGFETSTSMADSTARVTATSQTSLTSCTSGVIGTTSFCTTDSSYDQYHDPPTISKEMEAKMVKSSKGKAPTKKPLPQNKQSMPTKASKPPVQINKRKPLAVEKTAASTRPRRHGVVADRNNSDSVAIAEAK